MSFVCSRGMKKISYIPNCHKGKSDRSSHAAGISHLICFTKFAWRFYWPSHLVGQGRQLAPCKNDKFWLFNMWYQPSQLMVFACSVSLTWFFFCSFSLLLLVENSGVGYFTTVVSAPYVCTCLIYMSSWWTFEAISWHYFEFVRYAGTPEWAQRKTRLF